MTKSIGVQVLALVLLVSVVVASFSQVEGATRSARNQPVSPAQEAPISMPDCLSLERIAAGVDASDSQPINRWIDANRRGGLTLTAGVAAPEFAQAFGKPMLSWTRNDLAIFSPIINNCIQAATKAKRIAAQKQLIELRRVVQYHLSQPLNAVNRARRDVAANLEKLKTLPGSIEKLKVVALLSRLQELSQQEGAQQVRMPIEQMRHTAGTPGRLVAASLQNLPQAEADQYFTEIDALRDTLIEQQLTDLDQQLRNTSKSLAGLVSIDAVVAAANRDLLDIAPQPRLVELLKRAEQVREQVWQALEHNIAAFSDDEQGAQELNALTASAEYRQLGESDRKRLDQLVSARREQVAEASVTGAAEKLSSFPATLDGLQKLVVFAAEERRRLGRQYVPEARQSFENAYHEVHQSRIAAVEDEFEDFLEDVPESRAGVGQIKQLLRAIDAPAKSNLYRTGLERAREIVSAVTRAERQQQCQQALPDLELDEDDAALAVMGFTTERLLLGDLLCDVALAGNQVHSFETPGFFGEDYRLKVTGRDGIYRTYILNLATVGPDREALVGVRVVDPTSERTLDVNQWRTVLAQLLPNNKAGKQARCNALLAKPEAQLSANEKMEAMGCMMESLLGQ